MLPADKSCGERSVNFALGVGYSVGTVLAIAGVVALVAIALLVTLAGPASFGFTIYAATLKPITLLYMLPIACALLVLDLQIAMNCCGCAGQAATALPEFVSHLGGNAGNHFTEAFT